MESRLLFVELRGAERSMETEKLVELDGVPLATSNRTVTAMQDIIEANQLMRVVVGATERFIEIQNRGFVLTEDIEVMLDYLPLIPLPGRTRNVIVAAVESRGYEAKDFTAVFARHLRQKAQEFLANPAARNLAYSVVFLADAMLENAEKIDESDK